MSLTAKKLMTASGVNTGTLTFSTPGTYSWQAPAGVSKIKSITGRGGSSTTSTVWVGYTGFISMGTTTSTQGTAIGGTLAWSTVQSSMSTLVSTANGITTNSNGAYSSPLTTISYFRNTNNSTWYTYSDTRNDTWRRVGTVTGNATLSAQTGNVPTNISFTMYNYSAGLQRATASTTLGTDSTAFGLTFPNNSTSSTFTNVNITPGQTYTIVVGTDAGVDTSFVTFEW